MVADIQQFYENEQLEMETSANKTRGMTRQEISDLPVSIKHSKQKKDGQLVCMICMEQFAQNEELRSLRCLHIFHTRCIDNWLVKTAVCPLCRVIQIKKEQVQTPRMMTGLDRRRGRNRGRNIGRTLLSGT